MVRCSFTYPCWTGIAYCTLLTWAETRQVRQLIIHGAVTSSINMVITGISRDISQLQIHPCQEKDPPKRDYSHPKNSPTHSLRSQRIWMFFLRTVRLSLTWLEVLTQQQHVSFKMAQVPPCSGIRKSIFYLFWSTTSVKLCWLFRAILRNLIPEKLNWECSLEWHSFVVLDRYLRSPRGSQVYWVPSSVFFHGLTRE